jgi:CBS domain-containing protein
MDREIARFLYDHPPFNLLPFDDVLHMTADLGFECYPPGYDILTYQGEPSNYLYIISEGSVDLIRKNEQGIMAPFDTLDEGDAFGHLSLIYNRPPNATVRTREETCTYLLPPNTFQQLRSDHPAFGRLFDETSLPQLTQMFHVQDTGKHPEFRLTLAELLHHPLVYIAPEVTVREVAQLMRRNQVDCLLVENDPPGIITERDLRNRVMAEGRDYDTPVREVMTSPILSMPADSLMFEALALMLKYHIRHLPVTENGQVLGIITHTDILREQSHSPLFLPRQLTQARSIEDFRAYTSQVTKMVGTLLKTEARVQDIGRVVAIAHDALLERLLADAERVLGAPPCPYGWLVLGSEGRYEQTLHTDQDNALVYADDAPPNADDYFRALAEQVVGQLVECGFPRCPGDIMATNPQWRQPLRVWQQYFDDWIHVPDEEALMRVGIFFDYRQVYGKLHVEQHLRPVLEQARSNSLFLSHLSKSALRQSPPLGFFRNLVVEQDGEGRDVVDLKVRGTALVVDLARLFALAAGSAETNTIARLRVSAPHSDLSEQGAEELQAAFEFLSMLRLRHQYGQIEQGLQPTNLVPVASLSSLERRDLKGAMRAIGSIQRSVSSMFGTGLMA